MRSTPFFLSVLFMLFSINNVAGAEQHIDPIRITVDESYKFRAENLVNLSRSEKMDAIGFTAFYRGVVATLQLEHGNEKDILECFNKNLNVWFDLIFDEYKQNKIKGSEVFLPVFIGTAFRVCKIPLERLNH